jgi:hypothetical protein
MQADELIRVSKQQQQQQQPQQQQQQQQHLIWFASQ